MRSPKLMIGTAGLLLASALTAGAAQAAPAATVACPVKLTVPSQVTIVSPTTQVPVKATFSCTIYSGEATFDLHNPNGTIDGTGRYVFRPGPTVYRAPQIAAANFVPGVHTGIGRPGTYSGGPGDSNSYQLVWSNTISVIKFGGMGGSSSGRTGSVVTVNGLFDEYRGAGYVHPVGRTEYLQRYTDGDWRTIVARPADSAGRTSVSFVDSSVAQYRWTSIDDKTTFAYSTPSTFR